MRNGSATGSPLQKRLHRVRTFDEIILSGLTKFFNVSLIAGRIRIEPVDGVRRSERKPSRRLLISLTLSSRTFIFAVLQAYIVLRGDDNARIVYLLESLHHFRPCFQSCTLDLLFHLLSSRRHASRSRCRAYLALSRASLRLCNALMLEI